MRSLTLLFLATTLTLFVSCGGSHDHDAHGAAETVTNTVAKVEKVMTKPELIKLEETPGAFNTKALTLEAGKAYNFEVTNKNVDKQIDMNSNHIYFVNAREPEDIEYFVNKYNASTLLIWNNRVEQITTNHADARVNDYIYDYYIENCGSLEEFRNNAKEFMYFLEQEK